MIAFALGFVCGAGFVAGALTLCALVAGNVPRRGIGS